jgi:tetratricopeptide (TPR) repeat protein
MGRFILSGVRYLEGMWMSKIIDKILLKLLVKSESAFTYTQEELWEHLVTKTNRLNNRGQYLKAVDVAKDALKVAEETFGSEHPNMAFSLSNLAILYQEQGKYVEAELLYKRALAISEKALGKDHPDVATVLENMAVLYEKIWKKDEAKELAERVKKIRSKNQ